MPMEIMQESKDDVVILTPKMGPGETDRQSIVPLRNELNRVVVEGFRKVAINLEHVDMINSSEIGTLIGCFRGIADRDGALIVCGLRLRVIEVLSITKMLGVFPIRVTLNETVVELAKLKVGKGISNKLVQMNPTLDQMRKWWDSVTQKQSRPAAPAPAQEPVAEVPVAEAPVAPVAVPTDSTPPLTDSQESWLEALALVSAVRAYCEARGIPFEMEMTLKELVSRSALQLAGKKQG